MTREWRDTFRERWVAQGGHFYEASDPKALDKVLKTAWTDLVGARFPAARVVISLPADLNMWPWDAWLREAGASEVVPWDPSRDMRALAAAAEVGVTGALWLAAETGTVAVAGGPLTGLLPTVLPPVHLVIVGVDALVPTVQEGLRALYAEDGLPPMVKLISGPSMTADIEGTLVVGVHGPGQVGVILYGNTENDGKKESA
ncbi:MAG: LUD domain-containing protein [Firmicutes bacterium]|nr:LUD domain-containing protein [Bacillota bacterium]